MTTKSLLLEVLNEALTGEVVSDGFKEPIAFNTIIENENIELTNDINLSTLVIKNLDELVNILEEYINLSLNRKMPIFYDNPEYETKKFIISHLFVNATTEDFLDPINFIKRQINFIKDESLTFFNDSKFIPLEGKLAGNMLRANNTTQSIQMETPQKMEFAITDGENEYIMPEISYGIDSGVCYIYSILDKKKNEVTPYVKKINRALYELNAGVSELESDEFKEYKEGKSDYYTENITDVTMSSVLSLSVFLNILKSKGITNIKVVPYLPLRYLSREIGASRIDNEERKQELLERNERIQHNITEKFIRTFRRIAAQVPNVEIVSYPYEFDEYLTIKLYNRLNSTNDMLNDINESIGKGR